MTIEQIVASLENPASGPTYSVTALAAGLARAGSLSSVRTVTRHPGVPENFSLGGADCIGHPLDRWPGAGVFYASRELKRALASRAGEVDVFHTHGLWLMPNVYPAWAVRAPDSRAKLVLSPRGMLGAEALRFSRWKKRLFWAALQRQGVLAAACLHATAESEYDEIRAFGLRQPVAVIPNGIDLPHLGVREGSAPTVLSLGRLHPKKGLDSLIRAWARIEPQHPEWRLRIVGPPELSYDNRLRGLVDELGLHSVSIQPPLYGEAKVAALREADLFVLPTLNENFGLVVAEALAAATPVISTRGAPWSGLESEDCGWWIDHGVDALSSALHVALGCSPERRAEMGVRGRDWMRRDFSWDSVASDMLDVYRWLVEGGAPPSTVRIAEAPR